MCLQERTHLFVISIHFFPLNTPCHAPFSNVRDLGLLLQIGFSAGDNVAPATKKALRMLFNPKLPLATLTTSIFLLLYKAFICPNLECAIQASSLILSPDCQALESVQKLAVKFVKWLHHIPCEVALQGLRLYSLARRRARVDLICIICRYYPVYVFYPV